MGLQQTARLVARNNSGRPRNVVPRANGEGDKMTYAKGNGWAVTVMVRRTTEAMRKRGLGWKVGEQCRVYQIPDRGRYIADIGQPQTGGREPRSDVVGGVGGVWVGGVQRRGKCNAMYSERG
jgi:hypothetical protein